MEPTGSVHADARRRASDELGQQVLLLRVQAHHRSRPQRQEVDVHAVPHQPRGAVDGDVLCRLHEEHRAHP